MARNRTSRQPEVLVRLRPGADGPMHAQVERALRDAVRSGRLPAGAPVPSTRTLAKDLGVSRGVIVEAYEQLIAEGFLTTRARGPTIVGWGARPTQPQPSEPEPASPRFDFRPGLPDLREFPREAWSRAARQVYRVLRPAQLGYLDPRGSPELRTALADYLGRVRAVSSDARQVVVCSGFAQALGVAARALASSGIRRIAVEDPGHPDQRQTLVDAGLVPVGLAVDALGITTEGLDRSRAQAALVTPAHQFPTGCVLDPERRRALLGWAERRSALIIEDDYDAEYRYDRSPVGALQGLLPERVIYAGSASKLLAPALRLGWLVVPRSLLDAAARIKREADLGSAFLEQLVFAEFLRSGALDRHLRRMRGLYRDRRDALLTALARHVPRWIPQGTAAGLHLMAVLPRGTDEQRVVQEAARRSVRLYPVARYRVANSGADAPAVAIGYASLSAREIAEGIARLHH